jgi:hypothetical protein
MSTLTRRSFLTITVSVGTLLLSIPNIGRGQQGQLSVSGKPEIMRSKAKSRIREQVEKISESSKMNLGYELTPEEKNKLANNLLRELETETASTYVFIDP